MLRWTTAVVVKLFSCPEHSKSRGLNSPVFVFVPEVAYTVFLVNLGNEI